MFELEHIGPIMERSVAEIKRRRDKILGQERIKGSNKVVESSQRNKTHGKIDLKCKAIAEYRLEKESF